MRSHDEFKDELLRRKREFDIRRNSLITRSVCAVLCLCLVLGFLLPGAAVPDTPTEPILHNPTSSTTPSTVLPTDSHGIRLDNTKTVNLLASFTPADIQGKPLDEAFTAAQMDFALELLKGSHDGGNTLVSPLSAMLALSMTASGAGGETLAQMEQVLCGGMDIRDWNGYLRYYVNSLPVTEAVKLSIANSIWYNNDKTLTVKPTFLQTVADHYDADIFAAPFGPAVLGDINHWISRETDGMITNALDKLEGVLYLINALAFDGKWAHCYAATDVTDHPFHTADGRVQTADMMFSTEALYLESENATGFMKEYAGGDYAFAAILPNEDLTLAEYLETLTPKDLTAMLENARQQQVYAGLPQFEYECDIALAEVLWDMGITDAFDGALADLTPMAVSAEGNLYIDRVIHKTFITVDMDGTKAAASTIGQVQVETAVVHSEEVILDRPFLYLIVDTQTNLPIFIGTLTDLG